MTKARIEELRDFYLRELAGDTLPFWIGHGLDREHGGLMDFLDREGNPLSTDKGGWIQGRFTWVLARSHNALCGTVWEKASNRGGGATSSDLPSWLEAAGECATFVRDKVLAGPGGRAYFELTREGKPLVLRRYLFSEAFAVIGLAEYARALGPGRGEPWLDKALATLEVHAANRGKLAPKIDPSVRRMRGHSETMILINVYQVLREAALAFGNAPSGPAADVTADDAATANAAAANAARYLALAGEYTRRIDGQVEELFRYFVKPELKAVLETVNEDGSLAEGCEGRCLNPGHAIETAWFLMEEGRWRGDRSLVERALPLLDWSLGRGWDLEQGGLFSFVDLEGKQPAQIEWDMKYWWPHCEATYACLLAWALTEEPRWERWFEVLHDYTWRHFPDPVHGEWFGYLRRDGSVANEAKGNHYKGAFHVPRFELYSGLLLDAIGSKGTGFASLAGRETLMRLSTAKDRLSGS